MKISLIFEHQVTIQFSLLKLQIVICHRKKDPPSVRYGADNSGAEMNAYEIEPAYSDVRLEGSTVHIGKVVKWFFMLLKF